MSLRRAFAPLFRYIYSRIRPHMRPKTKDEAENMRDILSKSYMVFAAITLMVATSYAVRHDEKFSTKKIIEKRLEDGAIVYRKYEGFTKTKDVVLNSIEDLNQLSESEPQKVLDSE